MHLLYIIGNEESRIFSGETFGVTEQFRVVWGDGAGETFGVTEQFRAFGVTEQFRVAGCD
jgi:hypothetical protein